MLGLFVAADKYRRSLLRGIKVLVGIDNKGWSSFKLVANVTTRQHCSVSGSSLAQIHFIARITETATQSVVLLLFWICIVTSDVVVVVDFVDSALVLLLSLQCSDLIAQGMADC
jgi:hypothetical protein